MINNAFINDKYKAYKATYREPQSEYVIQVSIPEEMFSYGPYCYKDSVTLTSRGHLCGMFSKKRAGYKTSQQAEDFLKTIKQKPGIHYSVIQASIS